MYKVILKAVLARNVCQHIEGMSYDMSTTQLSHVFPVSTLDFMYVLVYCRESQGIRIYLGACIQKAFFLHTKQSPAAIVE